MTDSYLNMTSRVHHEILQSYESICEFMLSSWAEFWQPYQEINNILASCFLRLVSAPILH